MKEPMETQMKRSNPKMSPEDKIRFEAKMAELRRKVDKRTDADVDLLSKIETQATKAQSELHLARRGRR